MEEITMKKLRAGIVGCGGIANAKHLPAMEKCGLYEVVAFCDIIPEQAQETKEKFGSSDAKVFTDYRELVKEDLDVVYVTTPNRSHSEISIAAMEAGKDVMCEKPMARTYAETEKMLETAKRTGRVLNIAYQNRYRPDSAYLKEMCILAGEQRLHNLSDYHQRRIAGIVVYVFQADVDRLFVVIWKHFQMVSGSIECRLQNREVDR